MIITIFNFLFGCRHADKSFPQRKKGPTIVGHVRPNYVACLHCGQEFVYSKVKL